MELEDLMENFVLGMEDTRLNLRWFNKPYIFTNERLDVVLKRLNLKDKKVLTTGSSGDQALYCLLYGAKEVKVFDVCPFAKMYYDYKVALIKNLTYEQFKKIMQHGFGMFNPLVYAKISHDLVGGSKQFWDNAFLEGFNHTDYDITRESDRWVEKCQYLLDSKIYNNIKTAINQNTKVSFLTCDIRDLQSYLQEEKFDVILLSNIIKYAKYWNDKRSVIYSFKDYSKLVKNLEKNLEKNGVIQIDYRYSDCLTRLMALKFYFPHGKLSSSTISPAEGAIFYTPLNENEN